MVVLRTYSQVKNFYKRMKKKYNSYHSEWCGCCTNHTKVEITYSHGNEVRIVVANLDQHRGTFSLTNKVLAVVRERSLVNRLKSL